MRHRRWYGEAPLDDQEHRHHPARLSGEGPTRTARAGREAAPRVGSEERVTLVYM